jgi:Response regulator containing CheY-like receiver, AAA-type ATPase, and DNA-binding domains
MQTNTQDLSASKRISARKARTGEAAGRIGPRRLLLAEDDGPFRFLLTSELRKDGYLIVAVSNGVDLIDILSDSLSPDGTFAPFDLVLSDLRMPGWPGLEALAKVGRNPGMPPFILFTAFGDEDTHKRALEIGAVTLLDKPFDIDYLRELAAQVLR